MGTLDHTIKTFGRHGFDNILVVTNHEADGTQIGDPKYYKNDSKHTPWKGNALQLVFGKSDVPLPTITTTPSDTCYLAEGGDGFLNLAFVSSGSGDAASNVHRNITVEPDPGDADWLSIDSDAGTIDIVGFVDLGTYVFTMTIANSAGSVSSSFELEAAITPTIGPAPDIQVSQGETVIIDVPYANGLVELNSTLPSWITMVVTGNVARFTASPSITDTATATINVGCTNCAAVIATIFDVTPIVSNQCPPTTIFDIGGATDPFVGNTSVAESNTIGLAHASLSIFGTTPTAGQMATKRNNNGGLMVGTVTVPTDGCGYKLRMGTAETFFDAADKRKFDVLVNGVVELADVDPWVLAGNAQNVLVGIDVDLVAGLNTITFTNKGTEPGGIAVLFMAELSCISCTSILSCPVAQPVTYTGTLSATATYSHSPTVTVSSDNNALVSEGGWITVSDDSAGTITFGGTAPSSDSTHVITVETNDGGTIETCQFTVSVADPVTDTVPVVNKPSDVVLSEGEAMPADHKFTVTDDGISPVVTLGTVVGDLTGIAISSVTGLITGAAPIGSGGDSNTVTFRATDDVGFDEKSITVSVTVPSGGTGNANQDDYRAFPSFNPATNLPSASAITAHTNFWLAYDFVKNGYTKAAKVKNGPMEERLEFSPVTNRPAQSTYNGTYAIARPWTLGCLYPLADALRTTGDIRVLTEFIYWSDRLKVHFEDPGLNGWDNRGYIYARYRNPSTDNSHGWQNDRNWLDEAMMMGTLSLLAWCFHENRDISSVYADHADYWFDYLDQNLIPKWLYRCAYAAVGGDPAYVPPTGLGLQNAINWNSADQIGTTGEKIQSSHPRKPMWGTNTMRHPTREFAHAAIMQIGAFYFLGRYFTDMAATKTPQGNWDQTAAEYVAEATAKATWWNNQVTIRNGGMTFWLFMNGTQGNAAIAQNPDGTRGLDTDGYAHHCTYWSALFGHLGFADWANSSKMIEVRKGWWNENFIDNNTPPTAGYSVLVIDRNWMWAYSGATNGLIATQMRTAGLLAPWDDTDNIRSRIDEWAIISESSHRIGLKTAVVNTIKTDATDLLHYCAQLSDELFNA